MNGFIQKPFMVDVHDRTKEAIGGAPSLWGVNESNMLNSKLTTPHLSRTFQRPRLYGRLQKLARRRLTLVVGGAGYGKTTLIASTIQHQKLQAVWYNLYIPSWQEVATTVLPVAYGAALLMISYRYLPIFPQEKELNPAIYGDPAGKGEPNPS